MSSSSSSKKRKLSHEDEQQDKKAKKTSSFKEQLKKKTMLYIPLLLPFFPIAIINSLILPYLTILLGELLYHFQDEDMSISALCVDDKNNELYALDTLHNVVRVYSTVSFEEIRQVKMPESEIESLGMCIDGDELYLCEFGMDRDRLLILDKMDGTKKREVLVLLPQNIVVDDYHVFTSTAECHSVRMFDKTDVKRFTNLMHGDFWESCEDFLMTSDGTYLYIGNNDTHQLKKMNKQGKEMQNVLLRDSHAMTFFIDHLFVLEESSVNEKAKIVRIYDTNLEQVGCLTLQNTKGWVSSYSPFVMSTANGGSIFVANADGKGITVFM